MASLREAALLGVADSGADSGSHAERGLLLRLRPESTTRAASLREADRGFFATARVVDSGSLAPRGHRGFSAPVGLAERGHDLRGQRAIGLLFGQGNVA